MPDPVSLPPPGVAGQLAPLVKCHHPLVDDPLAASHDWAASVHRRIVLCEVINVYMNTWTLLITLEPSVKSPYQNPAAPLVGHSRI